MSFKDNMKAKIRLDRVFRQLISTMKEPPGRWWLDKVLARELLDTHGAALAHAILFSTAADYGVHD